MDDLTDDEMLAELGLDTAASKKATRTVREERIISGFEDIQRFVTQFGHAPSHGESKDIFERLYAIRLDRIRALDECRLMLLPLDHQGLLSNSDAMANEEYLDDGALLAELGVDQPPEDHITVLRHVKPRAEVSAAEDIANRTPCADFESFRPLFAQVQKDLDGGVRRTRRFERKAEIEVGRFFIVNGQKAYIAMKGETFAQDYGDLDSRLRVIFDNGTESSMLMRSLQRALTKDETGRRITDGSPGPLFGQEAEDGDDESGTIYVLRSKSSHPTIVANRELIHKIGVTGHDLKARIAIAKTDPTFLMADVEIVATYELYNINRGKLEALIHGLFSAARLEIQIADRFGNPVKPREWFIVPLFLIDEAVSRIRDGSILKYQYDTSNAQLVERTDRTAAPG